MRGIKFRAWVPSLNRFFPATAGLPANPAVFDGTEWKEASPECIVQQFTGLKDKNGKEIYEGDIVEWRHDPLSPDVHKWPYPYRVEWQCDLARYCLVVPETWDRAYILNAEIAFEYAVVGNIHENPELLK